MNSIKHTFCTIITADYIHYALALNESLLRFNSNTKLNILISDRRVNFSHVEQEFPNLSFFYFDELCHKGIGQNIFDKYFAEDMDSFRWSMKPVFIKWLIEKGYDQVFFLDCDLYFLNSFDFLQEELNGNSILLTPHWRSSRPFDDKTNFDILQTSGLYNAGFLGVTKKSLPAMDWWASACHYKCIKQPEHGLFVDQAYLDLLPVYFEGVKILRHKGCNIANWNQLECKRTPGENKVLVNEKWDIVFIHFTHSTIQGIESGKDGLLKPYLEKQKVSLEKFKTWIPNTPKPNELCTTIIENNNTKNKVFSIPLKEKKPQNDFINPQCTAKNLDLFIIRKAILDNLTTKLPLFKGALLDVGCGQMPYKSLLTSTQSHVNQYIGLDFKDNPIHNNYPDITWQEGKIPLADYSIDCAIATEVLEHCPNPEEVMKEINRVLKPGGFFFFTVPFLWPLHEVPFDEYRYTPFSLKRHLHNTGFTNIQLAALGGWDASLAQMMGLWVRRRKMGKWKKQIASLMLMPLIYLLSQRRNKLEPINFRESTMITGLSGTARKHET